MRNQFCWWTRRQSGTPATVSIRAWENGARQTKLIKSPPRAISSKRLVSGQRCFITVCSCYLNFRFLLYWWGGKNGPQHPIYRCVLLCSFSLCWFLAAGPLLLFGSASACEANNLPANYAWYAYCGYVMEASEAAQWVNLPPRHLKRRTGDRR